MVFEGGYEEEEFVVHAKKFTEEEAVEEMFKYALDSELSHEEEILELCRKKYVKFYGKAPSYVEDYEDFEHGCYTFCKEGTGGSFPVWVFPLVDVRELLGGDNE